MRLMYMKFFWMLLSMLLLSSCCADLDKEKIRNELSKSLKIGDTHEKAELVLKNLVISSSYDEYQQRYQSNFTGKNCAFDKSVIIYIYINKSGLVSKIEVLNSYTFL